MYAAGEDPIEGADRDGLVDGLRARGHRHVLPLADPVELAAQVVDVAGDGDLVVCLGAGNITAWAQALPGQIEHILGATAEPTAPQPTSNTVPFPGTSGGRDTPREVRHDDYRRAPKDAPSDDQAAERLPTVRGQYRENVPLAEMTWFRVGGPCEVVFRPADEEDLIEFLSSRLDDVPITVVELDRTCSSVMAVCRAL